MTMVAAEKPPPSSLQLQQQTGATMVETAKPWEEEENQVKNCSLQHKGLESATTKCVDHKQLLSIGHYRKTGHHHTDYMRNSNHAIMVKCQGRQQ
jgi:hypothetical protein